MKHLKTIVLGASILFMAACNDANNDGVKDGDAKVDSPATSTSNALAEKDAQFLMDVAASNMAEIKMSQLAQQKGMNQEVKDIGKMLETDHSAVLSDVKNFASQKSVTLPAEEKDEAKSDHNKLNEKTGKEFDKDWCEHMIAMHKKSIDKFEGAQSDLTDAELKTWTSNTLPKLRTHLAKLQACEAKLK
ncbi:MAG: DUF4142 domain-containing protein [Chitinophagaceae bacterium]